MARKENCEYDPLLPKSSYTQTEGEGSMFRSIPHLIQPFHGLTPRSIETASSARTEEVAGCCFCRVRKTFLGLQKAIIKGCSAETSRSLMLAVFYLLGQVLLCIALIINWHTQTTGSLNIGETAVEYLMTIYMAIGVFGMFAVFSKENDTRFVIFTTNEKQASKYLIGSVYVFGGGSLFMTVVYLFSYAHCKYGYSHIVFSLFRFMYILCQMLFLQRFSLAIFHRSVGLVFLMFHILGTNMSIWIFYLIEETQLFSYKPKDQKYNECMKKSDVTLMASHWRGYMTPFSMEFCLICAGLIYSMASSMKHFPNDDGSIQTTIILGPKSLGQLSSTRSFSIIDGMEDDARARWQRQVMSKRFPPYAGAHPGFIFGLAISVIMAVSALVLENTNDLYWSLLFHHIYGSLVSVSQIIAMVVITRSLKHHEYVPQDFRSDDMLLVISFAGLFGWELLCAIAAIGEFRYPLRKLHVAVVVFFHNSINLISCLVQCGVIVRTLRFRNRMKSNKTHLLWNRNIMAFTMRRLSQAVIYVLMTNIGFWVLDSFFEIKHNGDLYFPVGIEFYNKSSWHLWTALLYPLCIFFRFHCATLLFEIWVRFGNQTRSNDDEETSEEKVRKKSLPSIETLVFRPEEKAAKKFISAPPKDYKDDIYRKYWSR